MWRRVHKKTGPKVLYVLSTYNSKPKGRGFHLKKNSKIDNKPEHVVQFIFKKKICEPENSDECFAAKLPKKHSSNNK